MLQDETRIYLVDDEVPARMAMAALVRTLGIQNLNLVEFSRAEAMLAEAAKQLPNLMLIDYSMPGLNGIEAIEKFRRFPRSEDVPVVLVTSHNDKHIRIAALKAGATDFFSKPTDPIEARARCGNLLKQNEQNLIIRDRAVFLERRVSEATRAITQREQETLLLLARAGEYRDEETGAHVIRMARYSRLIAEELKMASEEAEIIERAAPLHDIGKIGIPNEILLKPGKHSAAEMEIMRNHTTIGYEILRDSSSKYIQMGETIALSHHERFDGTGYPTGLKGYDIPLPARIVAVADVFDALTSNRPYKKAWPMEAALTHLRQETGHHFDPDCVEAFLARLPQACEIRDEYPDPVVESSPIF